MMRKLSLYLVCSLLALAVLAGVAEAKRKGPKAKVRGSAEGSATTGPVVRRSPGSIVVFDSGDQTDVREVRSSRCW